MGPEVFETMYQGQAPWDIPGPQPAFAALEESGEIRGAVLDAGCGTGENALYLASKGHVVWGIDFIKVAIERARAKASQRGLAVHFQEANALELGKLGRSFDTVIDSGLFHCFDDEQRPLYVAGLAQVLRPQGLFHMLCFSDREPPGEGPRRVSEQEIRDAFRTGWEIRMIRETALQIAEGPMVAKFSPGGPRAWLATIVRSGGG
jgi:2-polyprenyl-3-methyl-5-hydroxy-6-metoxy-1,4-benzoquinol methylase